ncbi:hypothetical protein OTERR_20080 [Oryzomicrobium terrae]|uniref:GGDEF domain-containing protein n=1 Tax=Oryzomicrobium terrae TaxID=1735038 RepID=A0A5C1EA13_9RHOO|nr:sensor domain-containing diguanylate cyclase [Oryzomicrobium terrae]QEL65484.1 hypothetical protein OTERR_20080 [Oryzomicrobium terrae]
MATTTASAATTSAEFDELRREVAYLRKRSEQLAASLVRADTIAAAIRHELEQKRRGFTLMGELAVTLGQDTDYASAFHAISRRINSALNMQRTAVLTPNDDGSFSAVVLQGYDEAEQQEIGGRTIVVPAEMLDPLRPVLLTRADPDERLAEVRSALGLPYLISSPVLLNGEVVALLVTGRVREQRPFLPRLGRSDVETVQAVGAYLAAVLTGQRLQQAENLANYDPLTGLPNLRLATDRLQQAVTLAARDGFKSAVMFVDLDGFKAINDTLGHAAGDATLRIVAQRLEASVRKSDTVGRIGGDEFIIILPHIEHAEGARVVAEKALAEICRPMDAYGLHCQVGASIGIAVFPEHGSDAATLLRRADEAMYGVKKSGKRAVHFVGGR